MSQLFYDPFQRLDKFIYYQGTELTKIKSTVQVFLRYGEKITIGKIKKISDNEYSIPLELSTDKISETGYTWMGETEIEIIKSQAYSPTANLSEEQKRTAVRNMITSHFTDFSIPFFLVTAEIVYPDESKGKSVSNTIKESGEVEIK